MVQSVWKSSKLGSVHLTADAGMGSSSVRPLGTRFGLPQGPHHSSFRPLSTKSPQWWVPSVWGGGRGPGARLCFASTVKSLAGEGS